MLSAQSGAVHCSACQQRKRLSPFCGRDADQAVILAFYHFDDHVCGREIDIRKRRFHHTGKALIKDTRNIRVFPVERFGIRSGEVSAHSVEIRLCVTDETDPVVNGERRDVKQGVRGFQQLVDGF